MSSKEDPAVINNRVRRRDGSCVARLVDPDVDLCGTLTTQGRGDPVTEVYPVRLEWGDHRRPEAQRVLLCRWHGEVSIGGRPSWRLRNMGKLRAYLQRMYEQHAAKGENL